MEMVNVNNDAVTPPSSPPTVESGLLGAPTYIVYRERWLQLTLFSLLSGMNALLWIAYAPWTLRAAEYFSVTPSHINQLSLVYMIVFIVLLVPSSAFVNWRGIRQAVMVGAVLNTLGAWVRYAGSQRGLEGYIWQMVGQTVCAIAQTLLLGAPARVSSAWFPTEERTRATAVMALFNQAGVAIGFVLGPAIVTSDDKIPLFLLIQAIAASVPTVGVLIRFRESPPSPPSPSSGSEEELAFLPSLKALVLNVHFLLLFFLFGIGIGAFYALSTLLEQLITPTGYGSTEAGWLGFVLVTVGIGAALIVSWIADRTRQFKILLMVSVVGLLLSQVWFTAKAVRPPKIYGLLIGCCAALGIFSSALLPLSFEVAADITYPVNAELSCNAILASAQAFGIILTLLLEGVEDSMGGYQNASWLLVGCLAIATILSIFFKPTYLRNEHEKKVHATP